jgi:hypothetical protein
VTECRLRVGLRFREPGEGNLSLRRLAVAGFCLAVGPLSATAAERRCGWLSNPTPGDLFLTDRQGAWWITSQAEALGPNAKGMEAVPRFDERQFVETNVPGSGHGYGCACLIVETNATVKPLRIIKVVSGQILPLAKCRSDRSLRHQW